MHSPFRPLLFAALAALPASHAGAFGTADPFGTEAITPPRPLLAPPVGGGFVPCRPLPAETAYGVLEVVAVKETLDDIGGLDVLKDWLVQRRDAFGRRASDYGLPPPRGLLIVGVPGTGKSLAAKATASVFGRPLLKLDAGRLFGGLVGQSEANLRTAIQTAEAIAPCVLFIDELEKGFAGSRGSGASDGGTASRVFGSFISWMQDKTAPVFVVATANDIAQLPPELLRKGRWDDLFFVDLPGDAERRKIWEIQIRKRGRDPASFDLRELVEMSAGCTGAEIEQAFVDALYAAFANGREPDTGHVCRAAAESIKAQGVSFNTEVASISIHGEELSSNPDVTARMFSTLASVNVNIEMITSSAFAVTCVVDATAVDRAVGALEKAFGLTV